MVEPGASPSEETSAAAQTRRVGSILFYSGLALVVVGIAIALAWEWYLAVVSLVGLLDLTIGWLLRTRAVAGAGAGGSQANPYARED